MKLMTSSSTNLSDDVLLIIRYRSLSALILQDRKRIDFLLDVVRESNEANKAKVDKYQERNNSLAVS